MKSSFSRERVNYATRSVSRCTNIGANEIGIPPVFARNLTFPVPVTLDNYSEMAQLIISGPQWPGASHVELDNGQILALVCQIFWQTRPGNLHAPVL